MSREQYQPGTLSPSFGAGSSSGDHQPQRSYGVINTNDDGGPEITYICGDCASKVSLRRGDPIRCPPCGHRILYKERTKRMVQFEAR